MKTQIKRARALVDEARESDDRTRSLSLLQEAVRLDPQAPEAFEALGKCYLELDELDRAEETLRIALDFEDNGWVHLYLGNVQYRRGDYAAAEVEYHLGGRVLAQDPSPLWCIGDVRWAAGDLIGAEDHYRQAVRLDADDSGSLARLGRFLIENDRREEGEPYLREALVCDPPSKYAVKWAKTFLVD